MSTEKMSDPDRNLTTSFVALAEGVQPPPDVGNPSVRADLTDRTGRESSAVNSSPDSDDGDTDTVRATVESTPINEFIHLAKFLSYAFPIEFPTVGTPSLVMTRAVGPLS